MENQGNTNPSIISPVSSNSSATPAPVVEKKVSNQADLIKTIALIAVGVIAVVFIGLFIWMYIQYNESKTNLEGKIDTAVAEAVDENTTKLETEFADREKNPYKAFAGPADYGELSFSYPKTWSLYEESAASNNGDDYAAYFNPDKVSVVDDATINAMRVFIVNESLEDVLDDYNDMVEDGEVTVRNTQVNGENANIYDGQITKELVGRVAVFKIRDKVVIMQTDAKIFFDDFDKVLSTVSFNK